MLLAMPQAYVQTNAVPAMQLKSYWAWVAHMGRLEMLQASQDNEQAAKQKGAAKEAALLECKTRLLLQDKDLLGKVVTDTLGNIEKKQARTYEELQAEQMEAEEVCSPHPALTLS